MSGWLAEEENIWTTLLFLPIFPMDDQQFFAFCQINRDVPMEKTAIGEVIIMSPTGGESRGSNSEINRRLANWAMRQGSGVSFDSSAGYLLTNHSVRSPDGSSVLRSRL
jgi:Uma2 family endonuclease